MLSKIIKTAVLALGGFTAAVLVFLAVLYLSHSGDHTVPPTTEDDPSLPVIEVGGYPFHGEVFGNPDNPVVIALHGGPGGDYRSILPLRRLADEYCVVFYDQRGAGLSPRAPAEELTVEQYIEDLNGMVELHSGDRPVILIGHSWGAMLASVYIGRYPGKVAKAVLAEPGYLDQHFREIYEERTGLADMKPGSQILKAMLTAFGESLHVKGPDRRARRDYFIFRYFTTPLPENPVAGYYREDNMENAAGESWRFGGEAGGEPRGHQALSGGMNGGPSNLVLSSHKG